jgi:hypothetical protein
LHSATRHSQHTFIQTICQESTKPPHGNFIFQDAVLFALNGTPPPLGPHFGKNEIALKPPKEGFRQITFTDMT